MKSMKCIAAVVLIVGCLVAAIPAQAQDNGCRSFRALLQARLGLVDGVPVWSGQVRGLLNGVVPLAGSLSYVPGYEITRTGQAGHETNLRFKFDFGDNGIFVTEADRSVFPLRTNVEDPFAFGDYVATAKVAPDAGISTFPFNNATGNISIIGTFVVDLFSFPDSLGVWNAEIRGKLCNVGR